MALFPHSEVPSWFVKDFNIAEAVDELFGLRALNVAVAHAVSKLKSKKRKLAPPAEIFKKEVFAFEGFSF